MSGKTVRKSTSLIVFESTVRAVCCVRVQSKPLSQALFSHLRGLAVLADRREDLALVLVGPVRGRRENPLHLLVAADLDDGRLVARRDHDRIVVRTVVDGVDMPPVAARSHARDVAERVGGFLLATRRKRGGVLPGRFLAKWNDSFRKYKPNKAGGSTGRPKSRKPRTRRCGASDASQGSGGGANAPTFCSGRVRQRKVLSASATDFTPATIFSGGTVTKEKRHVLTWSLGLFA